MVRFLFANVFVLVATQALAQIPTQTIRGRVIDKQAQFPLIGATVVIMESDPMKGTATDIDGYFRLEEVPVGRVGLHISFVGYNPLTLPNLNLSSGKELVLEIELEERVISAKEVEIVAYKDKEQPINDMATISARTFSVDETQRYAGTMNDVARMASNFAGIQQTDDSRNDIVVRGNSPLGILYRLEGVDIPNPNHFGSQSNTGGPISILNNNTLANSDFFSGAFPAEYGNALAGVFDLKMRNGNNEKREYVSQIGFNGAELLAEGPFTKKGRSSYLISYRYSTLDLFKALGIKFGTLSVPKYQDMSFKLNFPRKKGTTALFGIGGISKIELLDSDLDTANNLFTQAGEDIRFGSTVGAVGLTHSYLINEKTWIKLVIAANASTNEIDNDSLTPLDRTPVDIYNNNSMHGKVMGGLVLNKKFNSQHHLRLGFIADQLFFKLSDSTYVPPLDQFQILTDFDGSTQLIRPYVQWQYRLTNDLTLNLGGYYQYFVLNGTQSLEPRAGIRWQWSGLNAIGLGYGLHSQVQPVEVYFEQVLQPGGSYTSPNRSLKMTRSHQVVLGYDRTINEHLRLKIETYYQNIFDAPVDINPNGYSMLNQGADFGVGFPDTMQNEGTGLNYGAEITLERFLHRGFYFLLTGSLFESKYTGSDKVQHGTAFNTLYNGNLLLGKEWTLGKKKEDRKRLPILFTDLRFTIMGGKRHTPIDIDASILTGQTIREWDKPYSERHSDYWRLDLKIGFRLNGKKASQEWMVYLQNATGRKNVFSQNFNAATGGIDTTHQIGFLPIIQYKIEF